jgi:dihydrofolate reductase
MKIVLIAALAHHRVIGKDGKIPWHIPEDLARFKLLTTGHTILMGRKTYESIGRQLSNRRTVVLTSQRIDNVETSPSLQAAFEILREEESIFIAGGAEVYAQTLPLADKLYLTFIDRELEGDTYFPPYEDLLQKEFGLIKEEVYAGYTFLEYDRKR